MVGVDHVEKVCSHFHLFRLPTSLRAEFSSSDISDLSTDRKKTGKNVNMLINSPFRANQSFYCESRRGPAPSVELVINHEAACLRSYSGGT